MFILNAPNFCPFESVYNIPMSTLRRYLRTYLLGLGQSTFNSKMVFIRLVPVFLLNRTQAQLIL